MRWLNDPDTLRRDDGVTTIFLVLAMTAMLIGAALAIDVGHYVVEARSAQNSADATVLAVATDCALHGGPIADYSPYRKDGQTISAPVCGDGQATITVTKPVGKIFVQPAGDVDRSATAIWGALAGASTLPIVISDCEFDQQILEGTIDITLYLDDTKPQSGCSSLPGGFSQLAGAGCAVAVTSGDTVAGDPGADLQKVVPCITNPTSPSLPHDVLIPIYDAAACEAAGCTGKGPYLIRGLATFRVTGYSFNGNNYAGSLDKKCPDEQERGRYCIRGDFIRDATSGGTPGPGADFGTYQITLTD
jgi:hypothetical protein